MLVRISPGYSPLTGRLHTCYSPVRRSPPQITPCAAPRLACVRPVASVHPEPGSNSSLYLFFYLLGCYLFFDLLENWRGIKNFWFLFLDEACLVSTKSPIYKKCSLSLYYIICCSCILKDRCLKNPNPITIVIVEGIRLALHSAFVFQDFLCYY